MAGDHASLENWIRNWTGGSIPSPGVPLVMGDWYYATSTAVLGVTTHGGLALYGGPLDLEIDMTRMVRRAP